MPHLLERALAGAALTAAAAGIGYALFARSRVRVFARRAPPLPRATPPITVLKPVCGLDFELYENLCSFCEQEYPAYQVIFCVHDDGDPAVPVIRRVLARYPERDLALVVGDGRTAANPKIANLQSALALVKYDLLVIADADVRARPDCLRAVAATFDDGRVGAASCPYGADPSGGLASALGALHVNDHFAPSVLVARALEPPRFCLGATMAVRRSVLDEIGGPAALAVNLGDDYALGHAVAHRGYAVALVPHVVHVVVSEPSVTHLFAHELRWARTIRAQRPWGYAALIVTYPLPLAVLALVLGGISAPTVAAVLAAAIARVALHRAARAVFSPRARDATALIPVCDLFEIAVWLAGCFGTRVRWREQRLRVGEGGRLRRA